MVKTRELFMWLNARQPGKVLNGLSARQSEIFTEFPVKDSFKRLDGILCRFLKNVERFQKLCSFARAWGYYKSLDTEIYAYIASKR